MTDSILDEQPSTNFLPELVGEGKKYRDLEGLAKAYHNADTHIKMLERANDELRASYLKEREDSQNRAQLEDLAKLLQERGQAAVSTQPQTEAREQPKLEDFMSKIDEVLPAKIEQLETAKRQRENANQVMSRLKERFGDQYHSIVREQINSLGLTEDDLNVMARKSPAAVYKTLGLDERQEPFNAPPRGSTQFTPKGAPKKTWSYFQQIKKDNPKLYHDAKTINEMTRSAEELGDAFYDGDWSRL